VIDAATARALCTSLALCAALSFPAYCAEPLAGVARIGILAPQTNPAAEGVREGLRELGYVEGRNVVFESPQFDGTTEQASRLADDLVRSKVDVIAAGSTAAARAAMQATATIPVVFVGLGDPVWSGLASSLSKPSRNGTGVSVLGTELYPKRLEALHQLVPRAKLIAYLGNSSSPVAARLLDATRSGAQQLGVRLQTYDVRTVTEIEPALNAIKSGAAKALFVGGDVVFTAAAEEIARFVRSTKLPAVFPFREWHQHDVLMSYGPSLREAGLRAAGYIDKILKGAKPADLPIEQISKYELVINLRVARELGIHVPEDLLLRADEVIR
jgi:putative ABC transport system substrate-binding protein